MFTGHSQNYFVEAVALWLSFLPAFAIVALIAGAQAERLRRTLRPLVRTRVLDQFDNEPRRSLKRIGISVH